MSLNESLLYWYSRLVRVMSLACNRLINLITCGALILLKQQ
jgi:hypothetical protein